MKLLLAVLSLSVILVSCSKQGVVVPQTSAGQLFYKDGSIAIATMQAVQTGTSTVTVDFAAQYTNNVTTIEVMSGNTPSLLCAIGAIDLTGNISKTTSFTVTDTNLKGQTMYYMLRYTSNTGDWGYTPLVSVSLK